MPHLFSCERSTLSARIIVHEPFFEGDVPVDLQLLVDVVDNRLVVSLYKVQDALSSLDGLSFLVKLCLLLLRYGAPVVVTRPNMPGHFNLLGFFRTNLLRGSRAFFKIALPLTLSLIHASFHSAEV